MADQSIPKKNQAYQLNTTLVSQANPNLMQNLPTLAAGDVRVKTDAGIWGNSTNVPVNDGDVGAQVLLTAAEMNGDVVMVAWSDVADAEWQDQTWVIFPRSTLATDIATAVWNTLITSLTTAGSIGKLLIDNLDVTVSSVCTCVVNALISYTPIKKALQSTDLAMYRGDDWSQQISGLGDMTATSDIWFGMKDNKGDTDIQSVLLISQTLGLEVLNGVTITDPAVQAMASISVTGAPTAGIINVDIAASITAQIPASRKYDWDVQKDIGGTITSPRCGKCLVSADVVRTTT